MAIHPIEFRYGTPEMKRIWEQENKQQRMLDIESYQRNMQMKSKLKQTPNLLH